MSSPGGTGGNFDTGRIEDERIPGRGASTSKDSKWGKHKVCLSNRFSGSEGSVKEKVKATRVDPILEQPNDQS